MLKIGDFSKLSRVSIQTLRYYDNLGLLKPVEVDPFSGYRYYSVAQLARLNRILVLKGLGLSLEQITSLLDEQVSIEQLRGMLRLKQAEIQQKVQDELSRLTRVEARLRQIEQETSMSNYDVLTKKVAPLRVASLREVLPHYSHTGRLFQDLSAYLATQPLAHPCGPAFAMWHDGEYREKNVDTEAAIPVEGEIGATERFTVYELPGLEMAASLIYRGRIEAIGQAYEAALKWMEAHHYRMTGPHREVYLHWPAPGEDPGAAVIEILFPVEEVVS